MSSWFPDNVQETCIHFSAAPVTSAELRSNDFIGDKELSESFGGKEIDERTMRDAKEMDSCLDTIMLPSTTKSGVEVEEDMLAAAISSAKLFDVDKAVDEDLDMDAAEGRTRFLHKPWSFLRGYLERSKSDCDTGIEESGAKTKDQKKLAVLPQAKYPVYGYFPSRDAFVVVKCKLCGMAVKPVAHRAHMHLRHNVGLKSPEPTTPVVSVISPSFTSTSDAAEAPNPCSNIGTIPNAQTTAATAATLLKGVAKGLRKTAGAKSSVANSIASIQETVSPSADNYVVVAPHSADRPLKLTFRRARTNVGDASLPSHASSSDGRGGKDRRNPPVAAVTAITSSAVGRPSKSRLQPNSVAAPPTSDQRRNSQRVHQASVALVSATSSSVVSLPTANEEEIWNHEVTPTQSTSSANISDMTGLQPSLPTPKLSVPAPPALTSVVTFATPIIVNASAFQHQVYEHPKPLATSRFEKLSTQQAQAPPLSTSSLEYDDHACYFTSSYDFAKRRWPVYRRSTQSIRQACRKVLGSESGELDLVAHQDPLEFTQAIGSTDRPNVADAITASKRTLSSNRGQNYYVFNSDQKLPSNVAILHHAGANSRMVRVTGAVMNGPDCAQAMPPVIVTGGKYSSPPIASTNPNKSYTKVNINQLKSATTESHVALDLGALTCSGDSSFHYKQVSGSIIGAPMKSIAHQKRGSVKRSSSGLSTTAMGGFDQQAVSKKPRMQHLYRNNGRAVFEVDEIGNVAMGGSIISNVGMKTSPPPSLNHAHARQQLVKALQQAHNPNAASRRKPPPHTIRHQLTPIVISPSQTPQSSSPLQQQSSQPQQVVLVSVNGPTVLTGWHKLTNGTGDQQQQQVQTGFLQNGLVTTTAAVLETATSFGTRVIRPKLSMAPTAVPVFMAEAIQPSQSYRQSQHSLLTQRLSTPVSGYTPKQATQARFNRRSNSTIITLDDVPAYPIAQQQPVAQFRSVQPPQQISFTHGGGGVLRSTAVTSTSVLAGPIVLNMASMTKGGTSISATASPTSAIPVGAIIGQQASRQPSTPTSRTTGAVNDR